MQLSLKVESKFWPQLYPHKRPAKGPLELCLSRKTGAARYAIAVVKFDPTICVNQQVAAARRAVKQACDALWLIREVGVYLIFDCPTLPQLQDPKRLTDATGFHAVIVQGIHFISSDGSELPLFTQWGNRTFGDAEKICAELKAMID